MNTLFELNKADDAQAVAIILPLIERAPIVASKVAGHRPFSSPDQLCEAIRSELFKLAEAEQIALFRAHPELAPDNPLSMTGASQFEQGRLQLTSRQNPHRAQLTALNTQYQEKFGFPFIIALARHHDIDSVMTEFEMRLSGDRASEILRTIGQIYAVSEARVEALFNFNDTHKTISGAAD